MKKSADLLVWCIFTCLILSPLSWADNSWQNSDPSVETTVTGLEIPDAPNDFDLDEALFEWDLKIDQLLAQSTTETTDSTSEGSGSETVGEQRAELLVEEEAELLGESEEMAQLGELMANPLSYLWLLFAQNDTKWYDGDLLDTLNEDAKVQNTFLIQPVFSIQLTEKWKTIIRPVIPINSFETVGNVDISTGTVPEITGVDFDRKTGLGDIVLWTAFSNQYKPPFVWGFGPTIMMPTASDDQLGTGKWSAGPMLLGLSITEKWILGGVFQHWWSFAGDDDLTIDTSLGPVTVERSDVNLTDFQYITRYRYSAKTNIGVAPNIQYNWETNELSLPIGIGFDTLVKFGKLPVKVGIEAYYFAVQDDNFGPEYQLRFLFVPVVPAPPWSRSPRFD